MNPVTTIGPLNYGFETFVSFPVLARMTIDQIVKADKIDSHLVKTFKTSFLNHSKKSDEEVSKLLEAMRNVYVLAMPHQQPNLKKSYLEAFDSSDLFGSLEQCLVMEYKADEFLQIIRTAGRFVLSTNTKLKITQVDQQLIEKGKNAEGEFTINGIFIILGHIFKREGFTLNLTLEEKSPKALGKVNEKEESVVVQFIDCRVFLNATPAPIERPLIDIFKQMKEKQSPSFKFHPGQCVSFTNFPEEDLTQLKLRITETPAKAFVLIHELFKRTLPDQKILLVLSGNKVAYQIQETTGKVSLQASQGGYLEIMGKVSLKKSQDGRLRLEDNEPYNAVWNGEKAQAEGVIIKFTKNKLEVLDWDL